MRVFKRCASPSGPKLCTQLKTHFTFQHLLKLWFYHYKHCSVECGINSNETFLRNKNIILDWWDYMKLRSFKIEWNLVTWNKHYKLQLNFPGLLHWGQIITLKTLKLKEIFWSGSKLNLPSIEPHFCNLTMHVFKLRYFTEHMPCTFTQTQPLCFRANLVLNPPPHVPSSSSILAPQGVQGNAPDHFSATWNELGASLIWNVVWLECLVMKT